MRTLVLETSSQEGITLGICQQGWILKKSWIGHRWWKKRPNNFLLFQKNKKLWFKYTITAVKMYSSGLWELAGSVNGMEYTIFSTKWSRLFSSTFVLTISTLCNNCSTAYAFLSRIGLAFLHAIKNRSPFLPFRHFYSC